MCAVVWVKRLGSGNTRASNAQALAARSGMQFICTGDALGGDAGPEEKACGVA
jgi:hypothetical protein